MDICETVGANIRRLRIKRGMSQESLALAVNIQRGYLSQLERGTRNMTLLVLQEIAAVLGVKPAELLK